MTRRVIYSTMVSLDGFIEGPNRELDWVIVDEELHRYINDQQSAIDTYLYGRRMYEVMAGFWPTAESDPYAPQYFLEFAHLWKNMPKLVFSTTLAKVEWNSRLAREDIAQEVAELKALPGKNLAIGGAHLASTLMHLGLVDECQLFVQPIVLGGGTRLFPPLKSRTGLKLVEVVPYSSGVVLLRYQRQESVQRPATSEESSPRRRTHATDGYEASCPLCSPRDYGHPLHGSGPVLVGRGNRRVASLGLDCRDLGALIWATASNAFFSLIVRKALEDGTLPAELPGYPEHVLQVRQRLVPGPW